MKRVVVRKFAAKHHFLWPPIEERDRINAGDILCLIPRGLLPSGSKTRAFFEFPDADDIQAMFDSERL